MMNTTQTAQRKTSQDKVIYTAKSHTTGGRDGGAARTSDGRLDLTFAVPGRPGTGTNPEQLFAVGWSACFISAMGIAASKMKIALPSETAIDAEIDLHSGTDGYFLQARLNISVPGVPREEAQAVIDAAEQLCPYSKATKGNITVDITLV